MLRICIGSSFFISFSGPDSDPLTDLFVPDFAKGKEFETRDQCQKFLTESFHNDEFGEPLQTNLKFRLVLGGTSGNFFWSIIFLEKPNEKIHCVCICIFIIHRSCPC